MSSDLTWNDHFCFITTKAYKFLGIIRRTFTTNSISTKRQLYISLVRSQLTYCSIIWRPHLSKHIVVLEKVQKRGTKFILNDYSLGYKNRLVAIHLLPLMYQLELNDLMFFIKSLKHPSVHFNIKDFISFSKSNTRSSTYNKLIHTKSPTKSSRHFYFNRLSRLWNSLPPIDLDISLSTIKSTFNFIRCKIAFSLIDSAVACLRGPRSAFHAPARNFNLRDHPLDLICAEVQLQA